MAFNFEEHRLFCLQGDRYSGKENTTEFIHVRTFEFQESAKRIYAERKDEWSHQVMSRIQNVIDLQAPEPVYHQKCSVNFRTGYEIPKCFSDSNVATKKVKMLGRPVEVKRHAAFLEMISYFQKNDEEQMTI